MHHGRWRSIFVPLLIVAAVAPFAQSLGFGYVYDDTFAIRSNADLRGWGSVLEVWKHPYGGPEEAFSGVYRPLTMTIFAIVWNAGGAWPLWFHMLALAVHAVATVLVWRVLERGVGWMPAALAGLWFAVHPVHVEAVANIANSSEGLVAIFTCWLTLYLIRLSETPGNISWTSAAPAGALYLGAFLSKESGAVSPFLAALVVWGWRGPSPASDVTTAASLRRWIPVVVACATAAAIVLILRTLVLGGPDTGGPIVAAGLGGLSSAQRIWAMLSLGPTILQLLAWPIINNPHYGPAAFPSTAADWIAVATIALLLVAFVAATWLARRGDRRAWVALGWSVVAFLPASNLLVPTGQILAERTLYAPSIGAAMLLALVLAKAPGRESVQGVWRIARPAMIAAVALVVAVFAARSARWTEVWRDHPTLLDRMIAADSSSYVGYFLSGIVTGQNAPMDRALVLLERAYEKYPHDPGLTLDYSVALLHRGHSARAAPIATELMRYPALRSRAKAVAVYLDALGRTFGPESVVVAGRRLMSQTPSPTAALYLGRALELRGDSSAAGRVYREGTRAYPGDKALAARSAEFSASR